MSSSSSSFGHRQHDGGAGSNNNYLSSRSTCLASKKSGNNDDDDEVFAVFCNDVAEKYDRIDKIGCGTFGEVYKARCKTSGKFVALKRVLMPQNEGKANQEEGFPITALREIKLLQQLKHDNLIELIEVCRAKAKSSPKATFYLVFPFCDHDLASLLAISSSSSKPTLALPAIKSIMKQLLNGLFFIHANKCLHRDVKPGNILLTNEGVVRLGDFGLARALTHNCDNEHQGYTNRVITLWYRSPELLLGERNYGPPIDLWATGCVLAELFTRTPILPGNVEAEQLNLIVNLCGGSIACVPGGGGGGGGGGVKIAAENMERVVKRRLRPWITDSLALDLVDRLLALDPMVRLNADQALCHDFFYEDPKPSQKELGKILAASSPSAHHFVKKHHQPTWQGSRSTSSSFTDQLVFDRVY